VAVWKTALIVVSPSLFLLANLVFTIGVVAAKVVAIRAHAAMRANATGAGTADASRHHRSAYRAIGALVSMLSIAYVLSCLPMALGTSRAEAYDRHIAVLIATVTFVELVLSVHGAMSARRNKDLLVEAIKLTNLAASLILLVLTQTALMSFAYRGDATVYNGVCGMVFGSVAALIGVYMLARRLDQSRPVDEVYLDGDEQTRHEHEPYSGDDSARGERGEDSAGAVLQQRQQFHGDLADGSRTDSEQERGESGLVDGHPDHGAEDRRSAGDEAEEGEPAQPGALPGERGDDREALGRVVDGEADDEERAQGE